MIPFLSRFCQLIARLVNNLLDACNNCQADVKALTLLFGDAGTNAMQTDYVVFCVSCHFVYIS